MYSDKNLKIEFVSEPNKPLIFADSDLIRQCCILIIDNSVKFAGEDKEIKVSVLFSGDNVSMVFEDLGPGFSKEALDHLFELFGASDVLHIEGSGLSMAAVKMIMDIHNGNVEVENSSNSGAIVKLHFNTIIV